MTATLSQNLRGALQLRAATAAGFPASGHVAYDGVLFDPTVGVPWARMSLLDRTGRPFTVNAATKVHKGLFQVSIFYPAGTGTAGAEAVADNVCAVFNPGLRLVQGPETIFVDYVDRPQNIPEPDWIQAVTVVAWRAYSANN